jgi:YHS domain-containing protein
MRETAKSAPGEMPRAITGRREDMKMQPQDATASDQNHVNTSRGFTAAGAPLAVHGYDVVAYFTDGRPRPGKAAFTVLHDGAAYQFSTQTNQEAFEKNPERYTPQFGGFCAYGAALGAKFDGDPNLAKIVNGKLYLNLNPDIQNTWEKDIPGNIVKAEQNWTRIRDKAPSELK